MQTRTHLRPRPNKPTLAHYQEQVIVAAALRWHDAKTAQETDDACDTLHTAVAAYLRGGAA